MRALIALAVSLAAGTLCAGTGGGGQVVTTYQTLDCAPCQQVVQTVAAPQYQTITINEPRVKWTPTIEYVEREVQVAVPSVHLSSSVPSVATQCVPQQTASVPSVATQSMPVQVVQACPGGQCYAPTSNQSVPQNYVADSGRGTNVRFEPAMVITEDGEEKIIRTPIRSAIAARRLNRTSTFDKDPPGLFK